jgi:hypothetical protein
MFSVSCDVGRDRRGDGGEMPEHAPFNSRVDDRGNVNITLRLSLTNLGPRLTSPCVRIGCAVINRGRTFSIVISSEDVSVYVIIHSRGRKIIHHHACSGSPFTWNRIWMLRFNASEIYGRSTIAKEACIHHLCLWTCLISSFSNSHLPRLCRV